MEVINITKDGQKNEWNQFVATNGTLLQSWQWGEFKSQGGWRVYRLVVKERTKWILAAQILSRALPLGKSFFYTPEGPVFNLGATENERISALERALAAIKEIAQKERVIFLRIEPFFSLEADFASQLKKALCSFSFIPAFESIQPQYRLWIDLTKKEEEILRQMKHKGRYNIRLAQKYGVNILEADDIKKIDAFYLLYSETARRDKFLIRPKEYFQRLFQTLKSEGNLKMFFAYYQKHLLGALLMAGFGHYAHYLYGASSSRHRETMSAYLMQWEAIRAAKKEGYKIYDLGAIAPSEEKHKWKGLRDFKVKFGGKQVNLMGCFDLVYSPFWYNLFQIGEKIRRHE